MDNYLKLDREQIALAQLRRDAELGALLRRIPVGWTIEHYQHKTAGDLWLVTPAEGKKVEAFRPETALKTALEQANG